MIDFLERFRDDLRDLRFDRRELFLRRPPYFLMTTFGFLALLCRRLPDRLRLFDDFIRLVAASIPLEAIGPRDPAMAD